MAKSKNPETPPKDKIFTSAEEISQCIAKLRARIHQVEELKKDGLPYRDALRVTAEYQLRDTIREIFGERSPEWHQHQYLRIKINSKQSVNEMISLLQHLVVNLEERRLDLLGLRSASTDKNADKTTHAMPSEDAPPTAAVVASPQRSASVQAPRVIPTIQPVQAPEPAQATTPEEVKQPVIEPPAPPAPPARPTPLILVSQTKLKLSAEAVAHAPESSRIVSAPEPLRFQAAAEPPEHSNTEPPWENRMSAELRFPSPDSPTDLAECQRSGAAPEPLRNGNSATYSPAADPSPEESGDLDTIEHIRKLCLAFHRVARQLRQRRDERPTLDVEDERDVLDLLHALLSIEYDNVEPEEWAPTYANGSTRTDLWIKEEGVVIIAKKTKQGVGAKALTHQVSVDFERYGTHPDCRLMFCFIYDPEGRIGHPKGLEGDLTLDYNGRRVEALISPK